MLKSHTVITSQYTVAAICVELYYLQCKAIQVSSNQRQNEICWVKMSRVSTKSGADAVTATTYALWIKRCSRCIADGLRSTRGSVHFRWTKGLAPLQQITTDSVWACRCGNRVWVQVPASVPDTSSSSHFSAGAGRHHLSPKTQKHTIS